RRGGTELFGRRGPPSVAAEGDEAPDRLHDAEWPCSGEEAVTARQRAPDGEREHEPLVPRLDRVHDHHEREHYDAVCGDHDLIVDHPYGKMPDEDTIEEGHDMAIRDTM